MGRNGVCMHRFIIEPAWREADDIHILGEEAKHLAQVLRLRPGDHVVVFDGSGEEHEAELLTVGRQEARACRLATRTPDVEPQVEVTLLQGIPKSDKMDYIVQKAVELGVTRIVPVRTAHVVGRDTAELTNRVERWNRIAREAVKQSRRTVIPRVWPPATLQEAVSTWPGDLGVLLYENERKKDLKSLLKWYTMNRYHRLTLLVGPEGGISPAEAAYLATCGFQSVTLGNRILRTETASLAALAIVMYETDG